MKSLTREHLDFIERIHNVDLGDSCPIFVVAAVLKPDFLGKKRIVSGKGLTREEAFRSCLAEAVERWGAVFRQDYPGVWGTEREMVPPAVSPDSLLLISQNQYETVEEWNLKLSADHHLPRRLASDQPIFWVEAKSITRDARVLVPAAYCFLGYPFAQEQGFPVPDSNGLAAGDDLQTCISRGLLELIERDAVSIWWYGQIHRPEPQIDRSSFESLAAFEAWVDELDRKLWFLDLTTDLGVAVVAVLTSTREGEDLSFGFGAGWTSETAAKAALGELAQFEATKRLARYKLPDNITNFVQWSSKARLRDHPFLEPSTNDEERRIVPSVNTPVELVGLMKQKGLEVIGVDLSREELPLSVARVISPGLRPIWPRFAPGRLYDVPVVMRWRSTPLTERQLNPVPILY